MEGLAPVGLAVLLTLALFGLGGGMRLLVRELRVRRAWRADQRRWEARQRAATEQARAAPSEAPAPESEVAPAAKPKRAQAAAPTAGRSRRPLRLALAAGLVVLVGAAVGLVASDYLDVGALGLETSDTGGTERREAAAALDAEPLRTGAGGDGSGGNKRSGKRDGGRSGAPSPDEIQVAVLNATDATGLAAGVAQELGAAGFEVGAVDDAPESAEESVVMHAEGEKRAAGVVGRELGISKREPVSEETSAAAEGAPVVVVLGPDRAEAAL